MRGSSATRTIVAVLHSVLVCTTPNWTKRMGTCGYQLKSPSVTKSCATTGVSLVHGKFHLSTLGGALAKTPAYSGGLCGRGSGTVIELLPHARRTCWTLPSATWP